MSVDINNNGKVRLEELKAACDQYMEKHKECTKIANEEK